MTGLLAYRGLLLNGGAPPLTGWNAAVMALPSLWGWWKLDEVAGVSVSAVDASGNLRNATYTAAGTQTSGLFTGSAAAQATIGGRIQVPAYTLAATPRFTLGCFLRTTAGAAEQQIFSSSTVWQFRKNTSTNQLEFITVSPSVTTTTASTAINDGNPHLAIMVFDQALAAGSGRVKMYLDGSLNGSSSTALTLSSGSSSPGIGARSATVGTGLWTGAIDECFLCDTAISSTDVSNLWAARNT